MARTSYIGLSNPTQAFKELEPYSRRLDEMARSFHPSSAEHRALEHARLTLRTAAELITRQPFDRQVGNSDTGCIGEGFRR